MGIAMFKEAHEYEH
jgi:NAD-dependent SIR2 family protein deacetylase